MLFVGNSYTILCKLEICLLIKLIYYNCCRKVEINAKICVGWIENLHAILPHCIVISIIVIHLNFLS